MAWGSPPRRVHERADPERLPPPIIVIGGAAPGDMVELSAGALSVGLSADTAVLVRSEGWSDRREQAGFGYAICQICGFSVPERGWGAPLPRGFQAHLHLRRGGRCPSREQYWRHMALGTSELADVFRLCLEGPLAFPPAEEKALCLTLAVVLQQVAAALLMVDGRTLSPQISTSSAGEGRFVREAVLLDAAGSGLLQALVERRRELVAELLAFLERPEDANLVLFETQRLDEDLRPMALRAHLLDPERRAILAGLGDLVDQNLGIALREDARALALAWLDQDDPVLLSGHQVAEDAFAEDGLLRAVHGRALRGGRPTRLLLGRLPDSLGDEALLRTDLTALMDAGAEIGVGPIPGLPWGLFLGTPARARALGGLSADGTIPGGPAFGAGWPGKLPLRETAGAGPLLLEAYDAAWDAARPVVAADLLAPSEPAMQWITVPADSVESVWTDLTRLLAERAGLGPLADLGKLACVSYRDRYFASAAISFVRLVELIKALAPGPGARVQVVSRAPQGRGFASRTAKEILGAEDPPGNLTGLESDAMKKWLVDQIRPRRWSVTVTQTWNIPHARRLDLDFAPGERYRRIEILLEHGFQGVRPAPGRGPWIGRTRVTEEEHVIVRVV